MLLIPVSEHAQAVCVTDASVAMHATTSLTICHSFAPKSLILILFPCSLLCNEISSFPVVVDVVYG